MVLEPLAIQVFGIITAKTVPVVLDFIGSRLKGALSNKKDKGEVELLRKEIEELKRQLELKDAITDADIKTVESEIEKVRVFQAQHGLELISDNAHKQWLYQQFEKLNTQQTSQNDFRTEIRVREKSVPKDIAIVASSGPSGYKIGDNIRIHFRSSLDCYLTIFNMGSSGNITVLFPNRLFQDNFIRGNHVYTIPGEDYPFDYLLGGPAGIEKIQAISSRQKINLADIDFSHTGNIFYTSERSAAAKDILIAEKKMSELPPDNWAVSAFEFIVRE